MFNRILDEVRERLDSGPRGNLSSLFRESLLWSGWRSAEMQLDVGAPLSRLVKLIPIARMAGVPVFMVEWDSESLPRVVEKRAVHRALASKAARHLLVYVTSDDRQAAFVWAESRRVGGRNRVETRTLPFVAGSPARTTVEQLAKLAFDPGEFDLLGEVPPSLVLERLKAAFDVEAVTTRFFSSYKNVFEATRDAIQGLCVDDRHLFTQRLFNRLMFIVFLERKGWLAVNDRRDYLRSLWEDHLSWRRDHHEAVFYTDRLKLLFFEALNRPNEQRRGRPDASFDLKLGLVPYLNGGLFEPGEFDFNDSHIVVPDDVFERILDLFYHFNFTVTESTPLDVEVAVDPEMLGRIFEVLVTGRHETGSYYTPKVVVSFMCREALIGRLRDAHDDESPQAIRHFVEERDPADLRNPEGILKTLRSLRICDPACGSGAYLMGMMHELLELRYALFQKHHRDAQHVYDRKLEILQNNLYGVDVDQFAVNIARLRLWLSLVVDYEGGDPPPLPNLDFKIEVGDSLTPPSPASAARTLDQSAIDDHSRLKAEYLTAHHDLKLQLRGQIQESRRVLALWMRSGQATGMFDWAADFAEVFQEGGFDIVLANPPYVRADAQFKHIVTESDRLKEIERWKAYREKLVAGRNYRTLFEKWDLYIPFLERALDMLAPAGRMVFIIPDAYNAAKYAKKSHELFVTSSTVERIDFCSEIPLFDAGVNNTIIHFRNGAPALENSPVRVRRWGENRDDFEENERFLPSGAQSAWKERLFRPNECGRTVATGSLSSVPLEMLCYISVGMVVHADEKRAQGLFTLDDLISDSRDHTHPKPFVLGADLIRWIPKRIRFLEWGTNRAPALFRRPTFEKLYEVPEKIISMDLSGANTRAVYDDQQLFHNHSAWSFVPWHYLAGERNRSITKVSKYRDIHFEGDREIREELSRQVDPKFLLAIMNSSWATRWLSERRRSKMHIYPDDWKPLPIPVIPTEEQRDLIEQVERVLKLYEDFGHPLPSNAACEVDAIERKIDVLVEDLYAS